MAYHKRGKKFGRTSGQRKQMMRSLARSVILHRRVRTTEARAKGVRPYIEKMVTKAAVNDLPTRRLLLSRFNNDETAVRELLEDLGPKYKDRNGGYTRITKVETRPGSGRTCAVIEFV